MTIPMHRTLPFMQRGQESTVTIPRCVRCRKFHQFGVLGSTPDTILAMSGIAMLVAAFVFNLTALVCVAWLIGTLVLAGIAEALFPSRIKGESSKDQCPSLIHKTTLGWAVGKQPAGPPRSKSHEETLNRMRGALRQGDPSTGLDAIADLVPLAKQYTRLYTERDKLDTNLVDIKFAGYAEGILGDLMSAAKDGRTDARVAALRGLSALYAAGLPDALHSERLTQAKWEPFLAALEDSEPDLRSVAAESIANERDYEIDKVLCAVDPLFDCLDDANRVTRLCAAIALDYIRESLKSGWSPTSPIVTAELPKLEARLMTISSRPATQVDVLSVLRGEYAEVAAMRLAGIYARYPEGCYQGGKHYPAAEIVRIGRALDSQGGKELMLEVHAELARRVDPAFGSGEIVGAARNLEMRWDGIGQWRG